MADNTEKVNHLLDKIHNKILKDKNKSTLEGIEELLASLIVIVELQQQEIISLKTKMNILW